jgi:drug/metabolite transporter (DMT)-like permease
MVELLIVVIGIFLVIIASLCFILGFIYQKKGVTEGLPELKFEEGLISTLKTFTVFLKNRTWILGILIGLLGWFPYMIAIYLVGIVLVQPLTNIGLIFYVITATIILNEEVKRIEILSVILLAIAPIFFTLANISKVDFSLQEFQFGFLILMIILLSFSIFFYLISLKHKKRHIDGIFITFSGAILYSLSNILINIFTQALKVCQLNLFSFSGLSEIFFGIFWFDIPHFWLFFSFWGMIFFYIFGLILYQSGFQKVRTGFVCLIINSFSLFLSTIVGLFIFNQSFDNFLFFIIGMIIVGFCIATLSKFQAKLEKIENI